MIAVRKCWMCESDFYAVLLTVPFRFFFLTLNLCVLLECVLLLLMYFIFVLKNTIFRFKREWRYSKDAILKLLYKKFKADV